METDLPLLELIKKYHFKTTKTVVTEDNIAYTNNTCKYVSKKVRQMLGKKNDYEVGEKLVCRKYFKIIRKDEDNKSKSININKNFEYLITEITNKHMTLTDENTSESITLTLTQIETNFIHSYCNTCHSLQGSSIKKPITIHQWNFQHVSRKWLYTAITRATDLSNVYFMISDKDEKTETITEVDEDEKWRQRKIKSYFEQKVGRYSRQDLEAGRLNQISTENGLRYEYKEEFVNVEWLKNCINKCCGGCGCDFSFEVIDVDDDVKVESDITAQRLDNAIPHYLSNIIPMCRNCNCSNK